MRFLPNQSLALIFVIGVIYMILHIWQAFRMSRATFVRKVCIKFEHICKHVFCEYNLPVEATYIQETKIAAQKSIFLCDYLAKSDGVINEL